MEIDERLTQSAHALLDCLLLSITRPSPRRTRKIMGSYACRNLCGSRESCSTRTVGKNAQQAICPSVTANACTCAEYCVAARSRARRGSAEGVPDRARSGMTRRSAVRRSRRFARGIKTWPPRILLPLSAYGVFCRVGCPTSAHRWRVTTAHGLPRACTRVTADSRATRVV